MINDGRMTFDYNQVIMMSVIPIITTMFSSFFQSVSNDIKNLIIYILFTSFKYVWKWFNKYVLRKYDDYNKLYIELYIKNSGFDTPEITSEAYPLIWYFKTNNINVKTAKFIKNEMVPMTEPSRASDKKESTVTQSNYGIFNLKCLKGEDTASDVDNILICDDIYVDFIEIDNGRGYGGNQSAIIKSNKKSITELRLFYDKIKKDYEIESFSKKNKVFVYSGESKKSTTTFKEFELDKYQSFDNLFFKGKKELIKQLDNLKNEEYFMKNGLKRKVCLLITGKPGCGKTAVSSAITKYLGRCMVSLPIARIKTNGEVEDILYKREILGSTYSLDRLTFLFDEIDSLGKNDLQKKANVEERQKESSSQNIIVNTEDPKNDINQMFQKEDIFDMGQFLTLLDGNIDQENLVMVATANNIKNLEQALFRDGRLTLIEMGYSGKIEITEMIEYYCDVKLTDEEINEICDSQTIQPVTIKNICVNFSEKIKTGEMEISELISKINELYEMK